MLKDLQGQETFSLITNEKQSLSKNEIIEENVSSTMEARDQDSGMT